MTATSKSCSSVLLLKRHYVVSSIILTLLVAISIFSIVGYCRYSEYEYEQRVHFDLHERFLVADSLEEWQGPQFLERFDLLRFMFSRFVMIELEQQKAPDSVGDYEAAQLSRFQHLHTVMITGSNVTNESCRVLSKLTELRQLYIVSTSSLVNDRGVAHLSKMNSLQAVGIDSDGITDASVAILSHCNLNEVSLGSDRLTNKGVLQIPASMPLRNIYLRGDMINDQVADHISRFKDLRVLWVQSPLVSNNLIPPLTKLAHLQELGLSGSSIDDGVVPLLVSAFPELRTVYMSDTQVTVSGHKRLCEERPNVHFAYY